MKSFSVYYLLDPTDGGVRYVGYSSNPEKRYLTHIEQSPMRRTHKEAWINSLLNQGKLPTLSVRCVLQEAAEAKRIEVLLISLLKNRGVDLTNGTIGGDGSAGFKWSAENYAKHEKYWNERGRAEASLRQKGRQQTEQHVAAVMAANTPELLARRGAAIKAAWARRKGQPTKKKGKPSGRQPSLGLRWKMSDAGRKNMKAAWTPERRAAHAEHMRQRHAAAKSGPSWAECR